MTKEEVLKHLQKAGVNNLDDLVNKFAEDPNFRASSIEQAAPDLRINGWFCLCAFPDQK